MFFIELLKFDCELNLLFIVFEFVIFEKMFKFFLVVWLGILFWELKLNDELEMFFLFIFRRLIFGNGFWM